MSFELFLLVAGLISWTLFIVGTCLYERNVIKAMQELSDDIQELQDRMDKADKTPKPPET